METMHEKSEQIKAILSACDGTPTQKLIAILNAAGITASAEVASLIGVTQRAIQKANSSSPERTTVREPQFADANSSSPKANSSSPPSRADVFNNITTTPNKCLGDDKPKPRNRGTRLPADWRLPKAWGEWAKSSFIGTTDDQIRAEAERFHDFWIAKAGKDATKLDWQATWRNWCRNSKSLTGIDTGRKYNSGRMAYDERRAAEPTIKLSANTVLNAKPRLIEGWPNA